MLLLLPQACNRTPPERALMKHFETENALTVQFQNNYIGYMEYQLAHFSEKRAQLEGLFRTINSPFNKMTTVEQQAYQRHWQTLMQPLVDSLYANTRLMVMNEKEKATPAKLAKINELTIKMNLLESAAPNQQLLPQLFGTPK
ncbi:MAG TPA: hypothetical protein VJC18_07715 [bacterium]|nr:hypothetical protein [bacterium]